jgi:hypothetical protein
MNKSPLWFKVVVTVALLWNLVGLLAVAADLRLSADEIAALPEPQRAIYAARPTWSIVGSVIAVAGGTLGCLGLLVRQPWALFTLYASLIGVVLQDIGILAVVNPATGPTDVPVILQGVVLLIAVALIVLAHQRVARTSNPPT